MNQQEQSVGKGVCTMSNIAMFKCCVDLYDEHKLDDGYSFKCPVCGKVFESGILKRWTTDAKILEDLNEKGISPVKWFTPDGKPVQPGTDYDPSHSVCVEESEGVYTLKDLTKESEISLEELSSMFDDDLSDDNQMVDECRSYSQGDMSAVKTLHEEFGKYTNNALVDESMTSIVQADFEKYRQSAINKQMKKAMIHIILSGFLVLWNIVLIFFASGIHIGIRLGMLVLYVLTYLYVCIKVVKSYKDFCKAWNAK